MQENYRIRLAELGEVSVLAALIGRSARALCAVDYRPEQIEGALRGAFGVDTQLIRDGTYFAVDDDESAVVACGGWSFRKTLFGGDARAERDAERLVPPGDAAKIRAFFVHPDHARRGLGRLILERCEREARARGFTRLELMATLAGERFYSRHGYVAGEPIQYPLPGGLRIEFVPMSKDAA